MESCSVNNQNSGCDFGVRTTLSQNASTLEVVLENILLQQYTKHKFQDVGRCRLLTDAVLVSQSAMSAAVHSAPINLPSATSPPQAAVSGTAEGGVVEGSCMELALEGERLCKSGDCRTGVQFFEAAVQVGTDDLKTLSAIYSQLGNAYFYLQDYARALEYHKHDLNLARTIGDRIGEAKASGNLGNTLKVLGKFNEAIACCQRHLDISRQLSDKIGEARALYNLGNVFHAKGKHAGRSGNQDPGDFPEDVKEALQQAAQYYEQNLTLVRELGDRAAQGRACGNLGNTHYLLGNFLIAIEYHTERLAIAREFGDKSAERRAYNNLGNAYIFLGEFLVAAEQYKKTLQLAKQLVDRALEAQACYSLGNTYTLLKDYEKAIQYHAEHLRIARELQDRVGEGRACWSLGNAQASLGNHEKALQYANEHLHISREIGDHTGEMTAHMNLCDLKAILGLPPPEPPSENSPEGGVVCESDVAIDVLNKRPARFRRQSMENMELAGGKGARSRPPKLQKAATVASGLRPSDTSPDPPKPGPRRKGDDDSFFELLSRFQSRRIDDQRCSMGAASANADGESGQAGFLDLLAGLQGSRMNDQRAPMPSFPGLNNQEAVIGPLVSRRRQAEAADEQVATGRRGVSSRASLDDQFFDMLMRCQSSRIEEQRSTLQPSAANPGAPRGAGEGGVAVRRPPPAPTVPDEDFFSLIQRVQSNRLDEQRSAMPAPIPKRPLQHSTSAGGAGGTSAPLNGSTPGGAAKGQSQDGGGALDLGSKRGGHKSGSSKKKDKKDKQKH